jgi:hypothetical protein
MPPDVWAAFLRFIGTCWALPTGRQCIMKKRPLQRVAAVMGAASAALRCAGLRSATAALESSVPGGRGLQESIGKSTEGWHFTLRERYTLARRTFPPRRQLK